MEYISSSEKGLTLIPYILIGLSILVIICINQLKKDIVNKNFK